MANNENAPSRDVWSDWLLHRRQADDAGFERAIRGDIQGYLDRVLDGARLMPGTTLLDIGTGEGVLAFEAIRRVGPTLRVLLTDVSLPMLQHAQAQAELRRVRSQCEFIQCGADQLKGIDDASVDVVAMRSALAYVGDKPSAMREFFRVLKPGGRLSMAEPIFQDDAFTAQAMRVRLASGRDENLALLKLIHRCKALQFPDTPDEMARNPLTNFSERSLFHWAQAAGFQELHLQLHMDAERAKLPSWAVFLGAAPHPWAPTVAEILDKHFSAQEREVFEKALRPVIESGQSVGTSRMAYLQAVKPEPGTKASSLGALASLAPVA